MPLRVAVIGIGVWGQRHAATLVRLGDQTGLVRLVALADPDEARLSAQAAALRVPGYRDWREVLTLEALDAVCVCTPDPLHVEVALACLERGLHLLIEKPLATTTADAARIARAARESGRVVTVGHILRVVPQYRAVWEAVRDGKAGELIHLYARRNSLVTSGERIGGRTSLALFQAIHDLDILRWIAGPVTQVHAVATSRLLRHLGVADSLFAVLRFANGAIGCVECSWALPRESPTGLEQELEVVGTAGRLRLRMPGEGVEITADGGYRTPHLSLLGATPEALRAELLAFVCAVTGDQPVLITVDEAVEAVRLAEAVDRSIAAGQPVDVT
ncbi:MAG: Gfo/Idh/MocA family oxidoreductase [Armatimonadota bacterium]|nr:Gfo/Idh/MocA family oxidoreductase [Armatimonadota bacterium]